MACGCARKKSVQYLWYKGEADEPVVYQSEIQAKAKVMRKGGTYIPYDPKVDIGVQIAAAEARRGR